MINLVSPKKTSTKQTYIFVGKDRNDFLLQQLKDTKINVQYFDDYFLAFASCLSNVYTQTPPPYAFVVREDPEAREAYNFISSLQKCPELKLVPVILYNPINSRQNFKLAKEQGADDFYCGNFELQDMFDRIAMLHFLKSRRKTDIKAKIDHLAFKGSPGKRVFDIIFSSSLLIACSPLLLMIAVLIKLESKGPVFYYSKRVGTGYKIFEFYKFRSMNTNSDQQIKQLMHQNQYQSGAGATFVKINNDPRITRVGRFIRNTSLDELPQLINVLKGDMSIVGNRPLPLYEAEKITKDLWSKRFLAPAGLTGLWQVSKRGKKDMSAEERISLDMVYADKSSLWYDLKILFQTFPAMIQKESV